MGRGKGLPITWRAATGNFLFPPQVVCVYIYLYLYQSLFRHLYEYLLPLSHRVHNFVTLII